MYAKKSGAVLVAGLAWLLAMGAFCMHGAAEEPEPVWREFFLLGQYGQTFEDLPNFEAEGSQLLVTHPPTGPYFVWFDHAYGEFSYVEEFFDTTWYHFSETTHVTADGPTTYRFFWKDELPPPGALTCTGPEGDVMQEYLWLRGAFSGLDGTSPASWIVVSERDSLLFNQYRPIVYGAGWFSR